MLKNKTKIILAILSLAATIIFFKYFPGDISFQKLTSRPGDSVHPSRLTLACIFDGTLKSGQSLYLSLMEKEVPSEIILELTGVFGKVFDLRKSLAGDVFTLLTDQDHNLLSFEYWRGLKERYKVKNQNGKLIVESVPIELSCVIKTASGVVKNNLWDSMLEKLPHPELIAKFTEILDWEVDFLTETRNGNQFSIIYEEYHKGGKFVEYGDILACQYSLSDTTYKAFLYQDPQGRKEYYDPQGNSVRKSFLKSPLNYRRISSSFSFRRFHPVFKIYRPHLGVDYAAPVGTPVVSPADGKVIFTGWQRGLGKTIEIRHKNNLLTIFGHLSRYASGLKPGSLVKQKQVIGFVGSTGISTGSHLHYQIKLNGRDVNPTRISLPKGESLAKEYLADFQTQVENLQFGWNILASQTTQVHKLARAD